MRRGEMTAEQKCIIDNLRKAIFEYNVELAYESAKEAVEKGIDPVEALNAMTVAIREIGDAFGKGELWLPDLVGASDAMQGATPVLEEEMKRRGAKRESLGVVVAGTVFGDIHSIGKTMVTTLLTAAGYQVEDLGVNVKAEAFIEAIKKYGADLLAMSALMTTTMTEQEKVINALKKDGIREKVKVMVGGAAVTDDFAEEIGADGYDPTAPGAVALARKLLGKQ
jgi:corrinoid protein of di/trimethylamine methyltransferase